MLVRQFPVPRLRRTIPGLVGLRPADDKEGNPGCLRWYRRLSDLVACELLPEVVLNAAMNGHICPEGTGLI